MSVSNELRVFISSTFRDLHEERELLVKKIFPEIRALCRERGITFTEVDLRWGLTQEDAVLGQVTRTCLEEIDKCRPYFIGVTGRRYGYVPELHEYYKDPELLERWPWIEDAAMEGASIVDLEFRHAVLNDPASAADSARFFFRQYRPGIDDDEFDAEETVRLDDLKRRVRAAGLAAVDFDDPHALGELVRDKLLEIIKRDFADARPPTLLEEERARHAAFAASRRRAYIPNPDYLKRLSDWFTSQERPLILYAESGSGKSSLVSFWCEQLQRRQPELPIIEHYVGIGAGDSDHLGIIRHTIAEIKERFDRTEEIPATPADLEREFANWLGFGVGLPLLVIIDGINQLSGRALNLHWLPPALPPGVKLIISSTVEQTLVDLRVRGWVELGMQPLKERERESVIVRFLAEYHKALSPDQVQLIAEDAKSAHPLFLRTLLEELRLHGTHESLQRTLTSLLASTGTEDLFQRVLGRLEEIHSQDVVRAVMTLLWCSRAGLLEEELAPLTDIGRLKLSTLLLGLDYHLVRRDGVLTFFHDYLRRAVEKRYLTQESVRKEWYRLLAAYFEQTDATQRSTLELLHALEKLGDRERLNQVLGDIERFVGLWSIEPYEVLRLWSERQLSEVVDSYRTGLDGWEARHRQDDERLEALRALGAMFTRVGAWREGEHVTRKRLEIVRALGRRGAEAETLAGLAGFAERLGRTEEAEELARAAETIARELGDRPLIGLAAGERGAVHFSRAEYAKAMVCFSEQEAIARERGDRRGIASALARLGLLHGIRGEHDKALDCFARVQEIARELGDREGIARAVGSRGPIYAGLGEYDKALECFNEQERVARECASREGIATALWGRGLVQGRRGKHAEALACFAEYEEIAREIGDRGGISTALHVRGNAHADRGEYEKALACWREQEMIARELGDPNGIGLAVGNRCRVHLDRGEYEEALLCLREQEMIAREAADPNAVGVAVGNRGVVHLERGEYEEAMTCAARAMKTHGDIGFRYGMSYWLWCIAQSLLELYMRDGEMPPFLPSHVPEATAASWKAESLRSARKLAEECLAISEELSKSDTLFDARVLLARIAAVEGDSPLALATLRTLLDDTGDDAKRAEIHYRIWKIDADDADHRAEALRLYQSLTEKTRTLKYCGRIAELTAPTHS